MHSWLALLTPSHRLLRFADLGLGLVAGSVVALAESLGVRRLATRDVRHFAAVRLRDGRAFELVVPYRRASRRLCC